MAEPQQDAVDATVEQETCGLCGGTFDAPLEENHPEADCIAAREVAGGPPVAAATPEVQEMVRAAVEDALGSSAMVLADPADQHEGMIAMDAKDAASFVGALVRQAQEANLGKRWVYQLPYGGGDGLTIDAVQDITQQMNWSGRCAISLLPDTLTTEVVEADEGYGLEPFWKATIAAVDRKTGQIHMGVSMEPQKMRLKPDTAEKKRKAGATIGEDNKVFDRFSITKAVGKAGRNAMEAHIPEIVKLTLIAMAKKRPELVEKIKTGAEAKADALPAPLDTPEAREIKEECEAIYLQIGELGGGRGRLELTPGRFNGALANAQHDMVMLRTTKAWLLERREQIAKKLGEEVASS